MKRLAWFVVTFIAAAMIAMSFISHDSIENIYAQRLQTPLFTGFLTVGSFLLALKTFILLKLREEVYDSSTYKKLFDQMQELEPKLKRYAPLARLGNFLIYCVLAAFGTAIAQLTIGFIPYWYAAAFCMALALSTAVLVFYAWWQIRDNLNRWFQILEQEETVVS